MRYVETEVRPKRGWFHPVDQLVEEDPKVERTRIHQINLLEDETVVMLYELSGDRDHIERIVANNFQALAHSTSEVGGNTLVWAHVQPSDLVERLLRIPQEYNVVLETPLEFTDGGGVLCMFIGNREALDRATEALPDEVYLDIRRLGDYNPELGRFSDELTDRQCEILDTAIELGYYDRSRNVTYDDIGDELGCSGTTVGEHLRKIESSVIPEIRR